MTQNKPARPPAAPPAASKPAGNPHEPPAGDLPQASVDLDTADASTAPSMPNERDEKVGMTGGVPSKRIEQAHDDVEAGRQDTSRGLETNRAYQRQKEGG